MAAFNVPKATALRVALLAYSSTDHISAATGKTISVTISKNGGAFGNPSVGATVATEVASGFYFVDLSTTDTGTAGPLVILGTATGTDNVIAVYQVVDPTVAGSGVNVVSILGTASAGAAGYVAPDWGHVNAPTTTVALTNTTVGTATTLTQLTVADGVEVGLTWLAAIRVILAAAAGKTNGFLAALPAIGAHFRDSADSKNRITVTTDANGNRTSITLDGS